MAPPPDRHVRGVEGLRALAALGVLVAHIAIGTGWTLETSHRSIGVAVARGDIGVSIFFILSGFLLSMPMLGRMLQGDEPGPVRPYAIRRVARIYPAYWVALLAALLAGWWIGSPPAGFTNPFEATVPNLIVATGLVHIYRGATVIGPVSPAWSLATEVSFYVFVPILVAFIWRLARRSAERVAGLVTRAVAAMACLTAAWMYLLLVVADRPDLGIHSSWLPQHLDEFAVGIALALVRVRSPRVMTWFDTTAGIASSWAVAAAAFWAVSSRIGLPPHQIESAAYGVTRVQIVQRHYLYMVCALAAVAPVLLGTGRHGLVRWSLDNRVSRFLGEVSYGIYLWQLLVLDHVMRARGEAPFHGSLVPNLVLVTATTIAIATVSFYVVERPIQGAARRLIADRRWSWQVPSR